MIESKTFSDESVVNRIIYYDVNESGFTYRPDNGEKLILNWSDIQYIEDLSGFRVDIVTNKQIVVPIRYTTSGFSALLRTICFKLSEIRKESFHPHKFTLTLKYLLHFSFVISVLVLSLMSSLLASNYLFFLLLALFAPFGIFIQRQPISLTLDNHCLIVRKLFAESAYNYDEIRSIDFAVKSNDYGRTLCISINLKNGIQITIKKIDNIVLFFIMFQIKLNENKLHREA